MTHGIRHLQDHEIGSIEPIARSFFEEAKYPGQFDFGTFSAFWEPFVKQGFGEILIAEVKEKIVGLVGAVFTPCLYNGELTMTYQFWYVRPENRVSKLGANLFDMMLLRGYVRNASAALAGHILTINPDGCRAFFERRGFTLREYIFRKELK